MSVGYFSVWPFFLCLGSIFVTAMTPLFRPADTAPGIQTKRIATVDGMRGILALSVMFHHAAIYHRYLQDGSWEAPASHFFAVLGPVSVALFFMITGFLFWSQVISRHGTPNWKMLYIGRVFRIGPLYLAAVAIMFAVVFLSTGPARYQPWIRIIYQVVRWFSLGLLPHSEMINGYAHPELLLADVTWTLHWEWLFYLSLPILALFARRKNYHLWFVVIAIVFYKMYLHFGNGASVWKPVYIMHFLAGMMSASLRFVGKLARMPDWLGSAAIVLLVIFIFQDPIPTISTSGQLALGLVLYLVVSGHSMFGLLNSRPAIRLGDVSYGIYLLHGLMLALVYRWGYGRILALQSAVGHWLLSFMAALLLILVALAAHVWIERPGILLGRRLFMAPNGPDLKRFSADSKHTSQRC